MISIDKYEIINNEDGGQIFKIDYTNNSSEPIRVRIVMNDLLFRTTNYNTETIELYPNCSYW